MHSVMSIVVLISSRGPTPKITCANIKSTKLELTTNHERMHIISNLYNADCVSLILWLAVINFQILKCLALSKDNVKYCSQFRHRKLEFSLISQSLFVFFENCFHFQDVDF